MSAPSCSTWTARCSTPRKSISTALMALAAHGYTDDAADVCHAMVGLPGPACEAMLLEHYGERLSARRDQRAFLANRDATDRRRPAAQAGRLELLDGLAAADCPLAIVTSSSRRTAERTFRSPASASRFDTVLTLDDVTHGKPGPDLYLLAAARLGYGRKAASRWKIQITASHPRMPPARSPSWCRTWCRRPRKRARCARRCCRI